MSKCLKAAWCVVLGAVVAAPLARAQVPEKPPTPTYDDWTYDSPGPAKCVEIGNVYLHKGDLKGALSRFQEAVKDNPHYAPAYLGLGKVYERMKEKQKALDSLQALPRRTSLRQRRRRCQGRPASRGALAEGTGAEYPRRSDK